MEGRVRFTEQEFARSYRFPLTRTLLTATTEGAAQSIGIIRSQSLGEVTRLAVANQTSSSVNLTVNFIPEGGTIGASNREIASLAIPGNLSANLTELIGGLYESETEIRAFASVANALIIMGHIEGRL